MDFKFLGGLRIPGRMQGICLVCDRTSRLIRFNEGRREEGRREEGKEGREADQSTPRNHNRRSERPYKQNNRTSALPCHVLHPKSVARTKNSAHARRCSRSTILILWVPSFQWRNLVLSPARASNQS
jgi:hypothetical protein